MSESHREDGGTERIRTLAGAFVAFAVIVVSFFYIPQWIIADMPSFTRGTRVWIATAWVAASFAALGGWAWRTTDPAKNAGTRD